MNRSSAVVRGLRRLRVALLGCAGAVVLVSVAPHAALAAPLQDGESVIVAGDQSYCECVVTVEHVVTLGDLEGPGALMGEVRTVRRDSHGVYYVLEWREHQLYRFAPDGTALPTLVEEGEGPGEALGINTFDMVADSVIITDSRNGRMSVFAPDGQIARTVQFPGSVGDLAYVPSRGVVTNGRRRSRTSFGTPLHVFSLEAEYLASFGDELSEDEYRVLDWIRHVAPTDSSVWTAHPNRYVLEEWSFSGRRLRGVERQVEWFLPRQEGPAFSGPDEPRAPAVTDVVVDGRGYLRTLLLRGGERWAELLPPPIPGRDGEMIYPATAGMGLFESVVEIIDPAGQLVAKGVVQDELYGFVDPEHAFSYAEDEHGNPTISIWRIRLTRPS